MAAACYMHITREDTSKQFLNQERYKWSILACLGINVVCPCTNLIVLAEHHITCAYNNMHPEHLLAPMLEICLPLYFNAPCTLFQNSLVIPSLPPLPIQAVRGSGSGAPGLGAGGEV